MEPFRKLTARALPFRAINVDTDQIVPARFQWIPRASGYAGAMFHDLRHDDSGALRPESVFNDPRYQGVHILVAGRNFGCGSSREQAVWALADWGFRAIVAPSFSDIFFNNCAKNGLLAIVLPERRVDELAAQVEREDRPFEINVESQTIAGPDGLTDQFALGDFTKSCLLHGFDEIQYTLTKLDRIEAFEEARRPLVTAL